MKRMTNSLLMRQKWMMVLFLISAILSAVFTMSCALSVTDFLQLIFPSTEKSASVSVGRTPLEGLLNGVYLWLLEMDTMRALAVYALILFVLYGMKNVFSYVSVVSFAKIKTGILYEMRRGVHWASMKRSFKGWTGEQRGQWLSMMSNDMAEYEANVLESIRMIVQSLITMTIYVVMLFYLDWRLTLIVVGVMGVGTWLLSVSRKLKRESRRLQVLNGELMSMTYETLEGLKEIKAMVAIDYVNEKQSERNKIFTRKRTTIYRKIYAASPISDFVGNCIVVVILLLGAQRVLGADATLSSALFVSYLMIYVLLLTPIKDMSNGLAQIKKGKGVEERIAENLTGTEMGEDAALERDRGSVIDSVQMRDVSFSYGEDRVLEKINFDVPIGKRTAIVGVSGSGKSTLGRIIVGLLDEDGGEVIVNGARTKGEERRGWFAYVPQDPMLFNDTLENNIRFGREWISDAEVETAIEKAQLRAVVELLPDGIHTELGDGGGRLSGGERQRVSIARALAGNPDVMVMDEATSALDASTEDHLTMALERETGSQRCLTMLFIAHRMSTVARAERVYSVEEGRFVR